MPRTIRLLNETGDTTIGWTPEQDTKVRQWVADRMAEGYSFFFVNPHGVEVRVKTFDDAVVNGRRVVLANKDSDELLWNAGIFLVETGGEAQASGEVETQGRAKTPEQVVEGDTVAVRPAAGG